MDVKISKNKVISLLDEIASFIGEERDYISMNMNENNEELLQPIDNGLQEIESILNALYKIIE